MENAQPHLKKRLVGSQDWDDFITCDEGSPLPGGIGDIDYWKASFWEDFVGVTVRTYDPRTGLWRIYWVDNTFSGGVIQPPVVGKFEGSAGIFEGPDTLRHANPRALHLDSEPPSFVGCNEVGAEVEPK